MLCGALLINVLSVILLFTYVSFLFAFNIVNHISFIALLYIEYY